MSDPRPWTADEMMTVAAARLLWDGCVCFVGIGLPSAAANLARLTHAPGIVLIYESGTIGARPDVLPLSIGDGELAETATAVVPLPEIFAYWLQGGRIDVGFLGAAQIDRFGNLNSTVIGDYARPKTRLPGAGGAPEIATHAKQTFVVLKQSPRSFVPKLDFRTSVGFLDGDGSRARTGAAGAGPQVVITDYRRPEARAGHRGAAARGPLRGRHRRAGPGRHGLAAEGRGDTSTSWRPRPTTSSGSSATSTSGRASRTADRSRCRSEREGHEDPPRPDRAAGPQGAGHPRARRPGLVALLPARLPVRDVPRQGRRGLGRGRQPLPGLRRRHRRLRHRPRAPAGRAGGQGRGGQVPPHQLRLLARGLGAPRRAAQRARPDGRAGDDASSPSPGPRASRAR